MTASNDPTRLNQWIRSNPGRENLVRSEARARSPSTCSRYWGVEQLETALLD